MRKFAIILFIVSIVLIAVSIYLFTIDKPTVHHIQIVRHPFNKSIIAWYAVPPNGTPTCAVPTIPPPWYVNLWPETLTVGIVLLLVSVLLLRRKSGH